MGSSGVWYVMITAVFSVATERRFPPLLYRWVKREVESMVLLLFIPNSVLSDPHKVPRG
jgi:hypothetical protein